MKKFDINGYEFIELPDYFNYDKKNNIDYAILLCPDLKNKNLFPLNCNYRLKTTKNIKTKAFGFGNIDDEEPEDFYGEISNFTRNSAKIVFAESKQQIGGDSGAPIIIDDYIVGWAYAEKSGKFEGKELFTGYAFFLNQIPQIKKIVKCNKQRKNVLIFLFISVLSIFVFPLLSIVFLNSNNKIEKTDIDVKNEVVEEKFFNAKDTASFKVLIIPFKQYNSDLADYAVFVNKRLNRVHP